MIDLAPKGQKEVKMKTRKIIALALALVMAVSTLGVSALAADIETAGGTGSVPVTLTVPEGGGATFSVTVPTVLAISVNADSTTTCATTAKIVNNSTGSVKVSGIAVAGQNGWETVDFDSMIVANERINAKRVALQINAEKTTGADDISFAGANWAAINGLGGELAISYDAKVAPQIAECADQEIVHVVFTIGCND